MRSFVSKYGLGLALVVLGLSLLGAGAAWSYAHPSEDAPATPAARAQERLAGEGLALDARLGVDGLPVGVALPSVHVDPPAAAAAPLPGVSVDRDERVDLAGGAAIDASLHLVSGSHRDATTASDGGVAAQSARQVVVPVAPPVALAAAAFTLAGIAAWLAPSLKKLLFLPAIGLYAKVSKAEVFDNAVRERIFAAIRAQPGIAASDLARLTGVSWGTTIYHLDVLEQTQMVTSLRKGRYRRYFENGAVLPGTKDAVAVLQNPVTATVIATVKSAPGATQKELAGATGMSPQALHWHLTRLVGAGLVRKERAGRVVRHFTD